MYRLHKATILYSWKILGTAQHKQLKAQISVLKRFLSDNTDSLENLFRKLGMQANVFARLSRCKSLKLRKIEGQDFQFEVVYRIYE